MTSMRTPERCATSSMKASLLRAVRMPMVPTAAMAMAPTCFASAAIAAIAAAVRSIADGENSPPVADSPSPSLVTSARSTTVVHLPSAAASPTWNFTELVPTSITAYRGIRPSRAQTEQALQPTRIADVVELIEAHLPHRGKAARGVFELNGDRADRVSGAHRIGHVGAAAADGVVPAQLVNLDGAHGPRGLREPCLQLYERVGVAPGDGRDAQRRTDPGHLSGRQGELPLHDGPPLFEAF